MWFHIDVSSKHRRRVSGGPSKRRTLVCLYVLSGWGESFLLLSHVQQHVCVSQLRASLCLIRSYLPAQQHNKRIFKEDISLCLSAERLTADCLCACVCVRACERVCERSKQIHFNAEQMSFYFWENVRACGPSQCGGVVILQLLEHQTQTKGCLHVLTLDKCLVWLFAQLYQFSDRSLSLSSLTSLHLIWAQLMTHRNASSCLSEINHLRQLVLPIVWEAGH